MIFYFTGTGNTRWAAQQMAHATGDELRFIPDELRKARQHGEDESHNGVLYYELAEGERLGFCFPTHGWQPPHIVREFIRRAVFRCHASTYVYALTTCGDNMGYAMRIFDKELSAKGLRTDARFAVVMPESNVCFSFLHLDTPDGEARKIAAARKRMTHICDTVRERRHGVEDLVKGAIPFTYTYIIGGYYNKHLITDKHFWVDEEACICCGLCARLCPVDDITCTPSDHQTGKIQPPHWKHDGSCTNCLACYHHCPQHAIHWGKMQRGQYRFRNEK